MTNTTTTAQATVLTEEQLEAIANDWRWHVDHDPNNTIPTWLLLAMPQLITSHRALTEQVRVLAEALEGIAVTLEHENDPFLERDNAHDLLADIRDITDTTLAALEGSGESCPTPLTTR